MSHEVVPVASTGSPPPGLSLRHIATVLLLMVTLPVFVFSALVTLPLMLVAGAVEALGKVLLLEEQREPHSRQPSPF